MKNSFKSKNNRAKLGLNSAKMRNSVNSRVKTNSSVNSTADTYEETPKNARESALEGLQWLFDLGCSETHFHINDPATEDTIKEIGIRLPIEIAREFGEAFGEPDIIGLAYDEEYGEWYATDGECLIELPCRPEELQGMFADLGLDSSKCKTNSTKYKTNSSHKNATLNSAKQIDSEWFYTLSDVETVVQAVLEQLDKDEGASIVLEGTDTGIALMVTSSEGEESSVPVDLNIEGDELADAEEPIGEAEEY